MQTLTPTLFPCYAAADRESAAAIAAFLERGADIRVFLDEGEMLPGEDLAEKAREARMADIVLVLFSRNSLPPRWPRSQWEAALVREPAEEGTRIGFARCDDCAPPRVLAPQFDLAGPQRKGLRALKRWVRKRAATYSPPPITSESPAGAVQPADLEMLGIAIADRPGCETAAGRPLAFEFIHSYREDFDEIFRVECDSRSLTGLAGDLGAQLGLWLDEELPENLARLRDFCSEHRFLLLLDGDVTPAARELVFGGRCSTLIVEGGATEPPIEHLGDSLRRVQLAFRAPDPGADWAELCGLARLGRRLCSEQRRLAELYELMQQWSAAAQHRSDRGVLEESAREMVWILESWGLMEEAQRLEYQRATEFAEQMAFPW